MFCVQRLALVVDRPGIEVFAFKAQVDTLDGWAERLIHNFKFWLLSAANKFASPDAYSGVRFEL